MYFTSYRLTDLQIVAYVIVLKKKKKTFTNVFALKVQLEEDVSLW